MAKQYITPLPQVAGRFDADFIEAADSFLNQLPTTCVEMNSAIDDVNNWLGNKDEAYIKMYLGPKDSDPTTRNDGSALQVGDLYFNTTNNVMKTFDGANWTITQQYSDTDVLNKIKNVDGSGSGLDADLLDGLDSTQFVRSDVTEFDVTGTLNFKADNQFKINLFNTSNHPHSEIHFNSYNNYGSDYAYIRYDDDNDSYNMWGDSDENSALVLGVANDAQGTTSDVIALESPAGIFLNAPGVYVGDKTGSKVISLKDYVNDFSGSGYQKLPNGLIIQWGEVSVDVSANTSTLYSFTFPIAFPNACLQAYSTAGNYLGQTNTIESLATDSVSGYCQFNQDTTLVIRIFAIGY